MFLLLGTIVNIAVAWGCVMLIDGPDSFHEKDVIQASGERFPDVLRDHFDSISDGYPILIARFHFRRHGLDGALYLYRPVDDATLLLRRGVGVADRLEMSSGWPLIAMWGAETTLRVGSDYSEPATLVRELCIGGPVERIDFIAFLRGSDGGPRFIPLRPCWPGFIINTLFYTLLLWLLIATPFTARGMIRRRRGLCEKCAYPIGTWGGSPVCTECGADLTRLLRGRAGGRPHAIRSVESPGGRPR